MKLLLVCNAGMSTSLLVNRMEKIIKEKNLDVEIKALGVIQGEKEMNDWDVILLGPQVRHHMEFMKRRLTRDIPIEVINMRDYGLMNGENVLNRAFELYKNNQS